MIARRWLGSAALSMALVMITALGAGSVGRADAAGRAPLARRPPPMSTATPLYNYGFSTSNGTGLVSNLVADANGALYGTTHDGGSAGYGTVFQETPPGPGQKDWTHTVIYSFCGTRLCADGYYHDGTYPAAGLIFAEQPNGVTALFGTTQQGGDNGWGTVFRLSPPTAGHNSWTEEVLYNFANGSDGSDPLGRLFVDTRGPLILYGTTNGGGTGACRGGCGTVFQLTPPNRQHPIHWAETVLHSFGVGTDGKYPQAGVVSVPNAPFVLYGTTAEGGSSGYGTVFGLTPVDNGGTGWSESVVYAFAGGNDGSDPMAGLLPEVGGGLYGTTAYGGKNCDNTEGCGTVFKLVPPDKYIPSWTFAVLHSFDYFNSANGEYPLGDLIFGKDGAIYGTTEYGGTPVGDGTGPCDLLYPCGVVFRLTGAHIYWTFSIVYKFCTDDTGCPVGSHPTAGLTAVGGQLYGTTSYNGEGYACGCGAVFKLSYPSVAGTRPRRPPP